MTEQSIEQAITRLREILAEEPPEPESSRIRPQDRHYNREYYQWQKEVQEWENRIGDWQKAGLEAISGPGANAVHVEFYGEAVPATEIVLRTDGSVAFRPWSDDPDDPPPYGWTPPLELPKPGQSLEKFQQKNAKRNDYHSQWGLRHHAGSLLRERLMQDNNLSGKHLTLATTFGESAAPAETEWIRLTQDMLDTKALPRLKRWTGQDIRFNLQNYNLAMLTNGTLSELARTNPGALAWWMIRREAYNDIAQRRQSTYTNPSGPKPPWSAIPHHPSEVISPVRDEFQEAGGTRWKALASQPAAHVVEILKKEGPQSAAWIATALDQADLPERKPKPAPLKKRKKAEARQRMLQEPDTPAPGVPEPAGKLRQQPPVHIKLLMARLAKRTRAPGHDLDIRRKHLVGLPPKMPPWPENDPEKVAAAMTKMAALAFRAYAGAGTAGSPEKGVKELQPAFNEIADYVFAEPEAAARATTWRGLRKAADDWHGEASLRLQRLQLEDVIARAGSEFNQEWDAPLEEWASSTGFTARLLKNPTDLLKEAELLLHCVGNIAYANLCRDGASRIFHLEPLGLPQDGPDFQGQQRAKATTVELTHDGQQRWEVNQHTGYQNRRPTPQETQWAQELLGRWKQAAADELLKDLRQPGKEERMTTPGPTPPITEAWKHTIALLPAGAVEAMDRFYQENGIDPEEEHSFVCQAAKHAIAVKWINQGAWTADEDDWIEDVANDLYSNYEALILRRREQHDEEAIDKPAAASAFRSATAVFSALNAAGPLPKEKSEQALQAFMAVLEQASSNTPARTEDENAETRAWLIEKYIEEMNGPDALPDGWALCMHNQGTPDAYSHIVPNPMPPDDRPAAWANFQMHGVTTDWQSDDGGTINYCPCRTCRADTHYKATGNE